MSNNSLINLGDLSKPADTLIKKVSKAVGGIFAPFQIKRVAEAEAEATIIKARSETEASKIRTQSEIEEVELRQRTIHRLIAEETQRQKNMEDITAEALPYLNEDANPDDMYDDWIANFFDKCRIVSDDQMQSLWSRILAGEANAPDTYSKRTVNFVSELDKSDVDLFTKLCGFCWDIGYVVPLVFNFDVEIYNRNGIDFDVLRHLESIGLIQWEPAGHYEEDKLPRIINACYYDRWLRLEVPSHHYNYLEVGKVLLTKVGEELAPICGSQPVEGFYEYVKEQWKEYLPTDETD